MQMIFKAIEKKLFYVFAAGISLCLLFFVIGCFWIGHEVKRQRHEAQRDYGEREVVNETVVVSRKSDPYYGLAQEIAQAEKLEIVEEVADVLQFNPKYIILVASPDTVTAERLAGIGRFFQNHDYYPALGIISGSTFEKAEQLWARGNLAQAGNNYVGGDTEVPQLVYAPSIFDISAGVGKRVELNKQNLIETLKQADYIYWTRHTGATTWYWNEGAKDWGENDQLFVGDIPALKPIVIYSPTCKVFRPWEPGSVALGFVDRGAAAFVGFVNSPHLTAFLKYGLSVPGITSWKEFPLGIVAQIGNRAAVKTIFTSPQFFMLGDPRLYLSKAPPYQITSDTVDGQGRRVIDGESAANGVLAVKIDDGREYGFLEVKGITSASDKDLFYNSRLQTLNLGRDKYVLFLHAGGRFELRLSHATPLLWSLTDGLTDTLDYAWVVFWLDNYSDANPSILALSLPVFILIVLVKVLWQKKSMGSYAKIFIFAALLASIRLGYFLIRETDYTVSANLVGVTPLQIGAGTLGVFASAAGGLMVMKDSRRQIVRAMGLVFAVGRQFWLTGYRFAFLTLFNVAPQQVTGMTTAWIWNYNSFWPLLAVLVLEACIVLAAHRYFARS